MRVYVDVKFRLGRNGLEVMSSDMTFIDDVRFHDVISSYESGVERIAKDDGPSLSFWRRVLWMLRLRTP